MGGALDRRYGCVNLDVAVVLPDSPRPCRPSGPRFASSVSSPLLPASCPAVALSARVVRNFAPPACRAPLRLLPPSSSLSRKPSGPSVPSPIPSAGAASSQSISSSSSVHVALPSPSLSPPSTAALRRCLFPRLRLLRLACHRPEPCLLVLAIALAVVLLVHRVCEHCLARRSRSSFVRANARPITPLSTCAGYPSAVRE